jgi:hypothetical protein
LREKIENAASDHGIDTSEVFIVDPERFKDKKDGPCHSHEERKGFWTDVLNSLHLSHETLFNEARKLNEQRRLFDVGDYIPDLEARIEAIMKDK